MTLNERRAAVRAALIEDPCRSDRLIASLCRCSREMVGSIRRATETAPRAARTPRRGLDGKTYGRFPSGGRRKTRVQVARERLISILGELRDPAFAAEFAAAVPEQRASIGRLSRELAATATKLNRRPEPARRTA